MFRCLLIALLVYGALVAALVLFEARLVYPGAYMDSNRIPHAQVDSPVKLVAYESSEGQALQGHMLERRGAQGVLLYLHGNGTRAAWLEPRIRRFAERFNMHVLAAEFRGFDKSDFTPTEQSVIADAISARRYLCHRFGIEPDGIVLYGRSLGGGVAAALAAEGGAEAVILERTFDRLVDVAAGHYPWVPVGWVMGNRYDSIKRLARFAGPVIQLHGTEDRVVPMVHGRKLFESLTTPSKSWIQVEGLGHNDRLPDRELDLLVESLRKLTQTPSRSTTR
ncbi:MAG: alpha/beta hydrolase [Planctomycetota bacterium]|nr:alpha/beta hydrolase [Planctomycetota bacterium]